MEQTHILKGGTVDAARLGEGGEGVRRRKGQSVGERGWVGHTNRSHEIWKDFLHERNMNAKIRCFMCKHKTFHRRHWSEIFKNRFHSHKALSRSCCFSNTKSQNIAVTCTVTKTNGTLCKTPTHTYHNYQFHFMTFVGALLWILQRGVFC